MSVYDKLFKTADEQKYFRIALPAAVYEFSGFRGFDYGGVAGRGIHCCRQHFCAAPHGTSLLCPVHCVRRYAADREESRGKRCGGCFGTVTQVAVPCRYFYGAASHSVLFPAGKNLVADGRRKRLSSPGAAVQPHCHLFGICYAFRYMLRP